MALGIRKKKETAIDTRLVRVFDALGDATRFKLVRILEKRDKICVSEIAQEVGISTAGASQHLKILERAGLVQRNRMGQKICYRIETEDSKIREILGTVLGK